MKLQDLDEHVKVMWVSIAADEFWHQGHLDKLQKSIHHRNAIAELSIHKSEEIKVMVMGPDGFAAYLEEDIDFLTGYLGQDETALYWEFKGPGRLIIEKDKELYTDQEWVDLHSDDAEDEEHKPLPRHGPALMRMMVNYLESESHGFIDVDISAVVSENIATFTVLFLHGEEMAKPTEEEVTMNMWDIIECAIIGPEQMMPKPEVITESAIEDKLIDAFERLLPQKGFNNPRNIKYDNEEGGIYYVEFDYIPNTIPHVVPGNLNIPSPELITFLLTLIK